MTVIATQAYCNIDNENRGIAIKANLYHLNLSKTTLLILQVCEQYMPESFEHSVFAKFVESAEWTVQSIFSECR